jgi:uncharacterized protein (DUF2062 family)
LLYNCNMIRKVFKKNKSSGKFDAFIEKYKISREFLSINRKTVTRALLVGIFIAFIPMPMQMLAVLAVLPFFKFNVPIAISMVWLSNPVTMPFMYYIEYLTGNFLLMKKGIKSVELSMEWFQTNFDDIFIPLYFGAFFYSFVVSIAIFYISNWCWMSSVKKAQEAKRSRWFKIPPAIKGQETKSSKWFKIPPLIKGQEAKKSGWFKWL